MRRHVIALLSGLLFSVGLALAGMTRPSKVLGFLDITGNWDPSLAFVMLGAVGVYAAVYRWSKRLEEPIFGGSFASPSADRIDARLVIGAVVFGIGWGLAGYCPGPALASVATGMVQPLVFVAAMLVGLWTTRAVLAGR